MKIDKNQMAVAIALITAVASICTAMLNRFSPNEPAAEATYNQTSTTVDMLAEDIDANAADIRDIENKILRQCLRSIRKSNKAHDVGNATIESVRPKRRATKNRAKMPSYETTQQSQ